MPEPHAPSPPAGPDTSSAGPFAALEEAEALKRSLVRSVAWTGGARWLTQLVTWGSLVVMARLLTPDDYGLVGMAALYLGLVAILTEGGLGTSIVTLRQMSRNDVAQFNTVAVGLGLGGALLTTLAAVPLAAYFRRDELVTVLLALGGSAVLSSVRLVPGAVLQRDLRFRALAVIDATHALLTAAANVGFALLGFRYWALVLSGALANLVTAVASTLITRPGFAWPRATGVGRYVRFTRDVLLGRIAWYTYTNADFLVAGRVLGSAALGAYSFAWNIASVPVERITSLVTRVTPAYFSRVQHDAAGLARLLINVTEGLVYVTLPASVGLALVAPEVVLVMLGPQWTDAIVPLQILALYATVRSVVTLLPQLLTVRGETRFLMWNGIATALVLPLAFVYGSRWGAPGIAAAWVLVYPFFIVPLFIRAARSIRLRARDYLVPVLPAAVATLGMALAVGLVAWLLPDGTSMVARLAAKIGVGAAAFLVLGVLPQRERLRRVRELLRGRPTQAPAAGARA